MVLFYYPRPMFVYVSNRSLPGGGSLAIGGFGLSCCMGGLDEAGAATAAAPDVNVLVGVTFPNVGGSGFFSGRVFFTRIWLASVSRVISPVSRSMIRMHSFAFAFLTRPLKLKLKSFIIRSTYKVESHGLVVKTAGSQPRGREFNPSRRYIQATYILYIIWLVPWKIKY